jgi:S-DNA-T family DNA segregation ATPase FtsK/SpoIIIE
MPLESHRDPRRLISSEMEDRLLGLASRAGGVLLLAGVGGAWASLLTWSQSDPSLTHAAGGAPTNMLGAAGAIFADVMLNTLGFAAVFLLLAPMFWGIELMLAERILANRKKTSIFPLSLLLLAGGFASLPVAASWPFSHSFGGIVGDWVYKLSATVFSIAGLESALPLAGLAFFVGGFASLGYSVGLEREDINRLIERSRGFALRRRSLLQSLNERTQWLAGIVTRDPVFAPAPDLAFAAADVPVTSPSGRREPYLSVPPDLAASRASAPPPVGRAPMNGPAPIRVPWEEMDDSPLEPVDPLDAADHDDDFDTITDIDSRAIAERFAPPGAKRRAAAKAEREAREPVLAVRAKRKQAAPARNAQRAPVGYRAPGMNLLRRPAASKSNPELTQTALRGTARLLEEVLADFSIKGEVREIKPGPVITLFELEPARGTKSSRVVALAEDIARSMSVTSARAAVVPGRNVIGIELPNMRRETVLLREILESDAFQRSDSILPMALGKSIGGEPIVVDLARMPHLLVAGTTGSGKSVGVNAMVLSLLYRRSPEECKLLMIDPKMLELSVYNGIPHLLTPVVTDPHKAVAALNWVVAEMEERYKRMASLSVRNIEAFNSRVRSAQSRGESLSRTVQTGFDRETGQALYEHQEIATEPMPYIVVVVDEFADLMVVAGKEIEGAVQRLAQMARAAGIHLIMATQRPSVDVVTGTIKANFPARISFKVASKIDSRTILNEQGAEQLLGHGDMLYSTGSGQIVRAHGPFVSDEEVEGVTESLRRQGVPRYVEGITETASPDAQGDAARNGSGDELYDKAVALVLRDRKVSTSYLQRRLGIGYNRAADLVERMEREGLISPANNVGKREILLSGRETGAGGAAHH